MDWVSSFQRVKHSRGRNCQVFKIVRHRFLKSGTHDMCVFMYVCMCVCIKFVFVTGFVGCVPQETKAQWFKFPTVALDISDSPRVAMEPRTRPGQERTSLNGDIFTFHTREKITKASAS